MKRKLIICTLNLLVSIFILSCKKNIDHKDEPSRSVNESTAASQKIYIHNVQELYSAINDPENVGNTLVLAEGTYMLSPSYPKGGRLELLHNMSLVGQAGRPEAVIIDVSLLPLSSLVIPPTPTYPFTLRTGAIRTGDGENSIEWLTLQNDPSHSIRSLVQTDIVASPTTKLRVAHTIIKGSSIGLSILNRDPVASGRILEAQITDNEIADNVVPLFGAGLQIQNSSGVVNATIHVTMKRNNIHGNKGGILAFNASSQNNVLTVKSYNDVIEHNGIGVMCNGGFIQDASYPTLNNSLVFDGYATVIRENSGSPAPPFLYPACGVYAAGGEASPPFGLPGTSHQNSVTATFNGCIIENNGDNAQVFAYGAHSSFALPTIVGTFNSTTINLLGVSSLATATAIPSVPAESIATNTVAVFR